MYSFPIWNLSVVPCPGDHKCQVHKGPQIPVRRSSTREPEPSADLSSALLRADSRKPGASTHTQAMLTLLLGPSSPSPWAGSPPAARGRFPEVRRSPRGSSGPWRAGGTAGGTRPPAGWASPFPSVRQALTPQHPPQCFHVIGTQFISE